MDQVHNQCGWVGDDAVRCLLTDQEVPLEWNEGHLGGAWLCPQHWDQFEKEAAEQTKREIKGDLS